MTIVGDGLKLRVAHAPGMPGTFSPTARVGDPDMHHRTCHDACRDRWLAFSFEVGDGEKVPAIPSACTTHNFMHLVGGPCNVGGHHYGLLVLLLTKHQLRNNIKQYCTVACPQQMQQRLQSESHTCLTFYSNVRRIDWLVFMHCMQVFIILHVFVNYA